MTHSSSSSGPSICPECNGKGGGNCHHNTGLDSSQHYWAWVNCWLCDGKGTIGGDRYRKHMEALERGRWLRKQRIERGETMADMANRTGKSPAQISKEERGKV